jgi:hypothetical protein
MGSPILNQELNLGRFTNKSFQRRREKENKSMRLELKASCKENKKYGGEANCQVEVKKEV